MLRSLLWACLAPVIADCFTEANLTWNELNADVGFTGLVLASAVEFAAAARNDAGLGGRLSSYSAAVVQAHIALIQAESPQLLQTE